MDSYSYEGLRTFMQKYPVRAGGTEALKQTLNHPAATFVLALIDDWQKTKSKTD